MPDVSKIRLPDSTEVTLKDPRITEKNSIVPLVTKTYEGTDFIGTADNWNNSTRYFMSVVPDSATTYWHVKYRLQIWIPTDSSHRSATAIVEFFGYGVTMNAYRVWNTLSATTSATYYHVGYWLTATGLTNGYGHAIGESILYATNYTSSSWYRQFTVDLLEYSGCSVSLLDTPLKWSEWTGGNATNYARGGTSPNTYNATSAGLQETEDNDSTCVQAYDARAYKVGDTNIAAYNPIGEDDEGLLVPALSKPFLVDGPFYLYSSALTANATGSWAGLYYSHYNLQIRNGANYVEGVMYKPLYLKGTISGRWFTADSLAPYSTSLPVTNDGFYYYYIGNITASTASSKYTYVSFKLGTHPVYYHNGSSVVLWSPQANADWNAVSGPAQILNKPVFDSTPTQNSNNAVKSGGVYTALQGKQDSLVSGESIKTINNESLLGPGNIVVLNGQDGVGFGSISTQQDGTMVITLTNGDTITVDLNHVHPQYPKYVLLADEAAYEALATKESDTLYLIPEES